MIKTESNHTITLTEIDPSIALARAAMIYCDNFDRAGDRRRRAALSAKARDFLTARDRGPKT
jgi:hypothetical protein|tara:strand:- start:928 stop:1113 length:186 start_codon:yes stop_codon:yes gene_type:complete